MITINDLTTSELDYVRAKWKAETQELGRSVSRKEDRLTTRLDRQAENGTALAVLEGQLAHAQTMLALAQSTGQTSEVIAGQQATVDALQNQVDDHGSTVGYITNAEAVILQMEIDELEQGKTLRNTQITAITTLLGD